MARVTDVHHVAIVVPDLDLALAFWRDALGLPVEDMRDVPAEESRVAFLPIGHFQLELVRPELRTVVLNETEIVFVNETIQVNETINDTVQLINKTVEKRVERQKTRTEVVGAAPLGFSVGPAPTSNLRKGLDLQGGTRVVLRPGEDVSHERRRHRFRTIRTDRGCLSGPGGPPSSRF